MPADDRAHRHVGPGHDLTEDERLEEALGRDEAAVHQRVLELGQDGVDAHQTRRARRGRRSRTARAASQHELQRQPHGDRHRAARRTARRRRGSPPPPRPSAGRAPAALASGPGVAGSAVLASAGNRLQRNRRSSTMPATAIPRSGRLHPRPVHGERPRRARPRAPRPAGTGRGCRARLPTGPDQPVAEVRREVDDVGAGEKLGHGEHLGELVRASASPGAGPPRPRKGEAARRAEAQRPDGALTRSQSASGDRTVRGHFFFSAHSACVTTGSCSARSRSRSRFPMCSDSGACTHL